MTISYRPLSDFQPNLHQNPRKCLIEGNYIFNFIDLEWEFRDSEVDYYKCSLQEMSSDPKVLKFFLRALAVEAATCLPAVRLNFFFQSTEDAKKIYDAFEEGSKKDYPNVNVLYHSENQLVYAMTDASESSWAFHEISKVADSLDIFVTGFNRETVDKQFPEIVKG